MVVSQKLAEDESVYAQVVKRPTAFWLGSPIVWPLGPGQGPFPGTGKTAPQILGSLSSHSLQEGH